MCYSGDLIATLPGIREACRRLNATAEIYLWLDKHGKPYDGADHPYGGAMQSEYTCKMLKPLLEEQEYISLVKPWEGEKIIVDLDDLRQNIVGMPYGSLHRWPFYLWPDMSCDLSVRWINAFGSDFEFDEATPQYHTDKIIINRTSRYHNHYINYFFLREHQSKLLFAGLKEERDAFCKQWELDIPLLDVDDFLELARYIQSCRFFIGNQSMCFGIAEAIKVPRLLEVCPYAPNVIPTGKDAFDFQRQEALEFLFKEMDDKF